MDPIKTRWCEKPTTVPGSMWTDEEGNIWVTETGDTTMRLRTYVSHEEALFSELEDAAFDVYYEGIRCHF